MWRARSLAPTCPLIPSNEVLKGTLSPLLAQAQPQDHSMREFFFSSPSRFLVVKTPTRLVFCLRLLRRPLSEGRQGKGRRAYNTVNYLSFPRIEQSWGTVVIPVTDFFCYPVDQEILVYRVSPASGVNEGLRLLCAYFFPLCALDAHEDSHRFSALALDAP